MKQVQGLQRFVHMIFRSTSIHFLLPISLIAVLLASEGAYSSYSNICRNFYAENSPVSKFNFHLLVKDTPELQQTVSNIEKTFFKLFSKFESAGLKTPSKINIIFLDQKSTAELDMSAMGSSTIFVPWISDRADRSQIAEWVVSHELGHNIFTKNLVEKYPSLRAQDELISSLDSNLVAGRAKVINNQIHAKIPEIVRLKSAVAAARENNNLELLEKLEEAFLKEKDLQRKEIEEIDNLPPAYIGLYEAMAVHSGMVKFIYEKNKLYQELFADLVTELAYNSNGNFTETQIENLVGGKSQTGPRDFSKKRKVGLFSPPLKHWWRKTFRSKEAFDHKDIHDITGNARYYIWTKLLKASPYKTDPFMLLKAIFETSLADLEDMYKKNIKDPQDLGEEYLNWRLIWRIKNYRPIKTQ